MSKICARCDAINKDSALKCSNCGYRSFLKMQNEEATMPASEEPKEKTPSCAAETTDAPAAGEDAEPQSEDKKLDDIINTFLSSEVQNEVVESKRSDKKKKRRRRRWMICGFVLPCMLFAVFMIFLYKFLYGLENYSVEAYLQKYLSLIESKDYDAIIEYEGIELNEFNHREEFIKYMSAKYGDNPQNIKYVKRITSDQDEAAYYTIQPEGGKTASVKLIKTGNKKMQIFDEWRVKPDTNSMYEETATIYSPPGVKIYLNGTLVTEEYLIPYKYRQVGQYSVVKDEGYSPPKLMCYEVSGLMAISSVEAESTQTVDCAVVKQEESGNVYEVSASMDGEEAESFKALAWEVAQTYADFINEDARRSDINRYLYENTEFYDAIQEFDNYWFPIHDDSGHEGDIEYSEMNWYDENHRSINIKTTYYVTNNGKKKEYPIDYTIYFLRVGEEWKVTSISYV